VMSTASVRVTCRMISAACITAKDTSSASLICGRIPTTSRHGAS
jgi:hypothetical protein